MKDASLRSQLALRFVDRWPLESCLEILAYCVSDMAVPEELKSELQRKLMELRVYQKVKTVALRQKSGRLLWDVCHIQAEEAQGDSPRSAT